jgi:hypothetical protein
MLGSPVPFFPGQTYVGPSLPTQLGVNSQMLSSLLGAQGAADLYGSAKASQPYYQAGANMGQGVSGQYGASANLANNAIGGQMGLNNMSLGNYGMLSNAANVGANPYVQDMLQTNRNQIGEALQEDWMPSLNLGMSRTGTGAVGSSRHGLAQAETVQNAAKELGRANNALQLGAYGQGLGAQQTALGQTGQMLGNQLAPARSAGYAADQGRAGMNVMGDAGAMMQRGNSDFLSNLTGAGGLMTSANQGMLGAGQTVENYQGRALQDAMSRFAHQFTEPGERLGLANSLMGMFQPLGTGYSNTATNTNTSGTGTGANPNYQTPFQGLLGGAAAGAGIGTDFNGWNPFGNPYQSAPNQTIGPSTPIPGL